MPKPISCPRRLQVAVRVPMASRSSRAMSTAWSAGFSTGTGSLKTTKSRHHQRTVRAGGFTGLTESADAEDVMALLRDYHAAIGEIVIKYGGTLERYAGDGVMVVFNDPVPVENPALQAVLMALEMRDAIGSLTEKWRQWGHDIGFGIG